jgi:hypothetical protein
VSAAGAEVKREYVGKNNNSNYMDINKNEKSIKLIWFISNGFESFS